MDKQFLEVEMVSCDICCKEVPISAAHTPEAVDYIVYFCGLECYETWQGKTLPGETEKNSG